MFWNPANEISQIEVGTILAWPNLDIPDSYLECDGSLLSRATYWELFAAIGETWGAGDRLTTFAIPDFRGVFLRGYDHAKGYDLGRVFATYQSDSTKYAHFYKSTGAPVFWIEDGAVIPTGEGPYNSRETRPKNSSLYWCIKYQS